MDDAIRLLRTMVSDDNLRTEQKDALLEVIEQLEAKKADADLRRDLIDLASIAGLVKIVLDALS